MGASGDRVAQLSRLHNDLASPDFQGAQTSLLPGLRRYTGASSSGRDRMTPEEPVALINAVAEPRVVVSAWTSFVDGRMLVVRPQVFRCGSCREAWWRPASR